MSNVPRSFGRRLSSHAIVFISNFILGDLYKNDKSCFMWQENRAQCPSLDIYWYLYLHFTHSCPQETAKDIASKNATTYFVIAQNKTNLYKKKSYLLFNMYMYILLILLWFKEKHNIFLIFDFRIFLARVTILLDWKSYLHGYLLFLKDSHKTLLIFGQYIYDKCLNGHCYTIL